MTAGSPWVRKELPWLRSGPLYRVDASAEDELSAFLRGFRYRYVELDGARMTSRLAAQDELARAFGFPDDYGRNWDAFSDSLGERLIGSEGDMLAVLWRGFVTAAAQAPATTAEVVWALLDAGGPATGGSGDRWSVGLDVFVLGSGPDFDRPDGAPGFAASSDASPVGFVTPESHSGESLSDGSA